MIHMENPILRHEPAQLWLQVFIDLLPSRVDHLVCLEHLTKVSFVQSLP